MRKEQLLLDDKTRGLCKEPYFACSENGMDKSNNDSGEQISEVIS